MPHSKPLYNLGLHEFWKLTCQRFNVILNALESTTKRRLNSTDNCFLASEQEVEVSGREEGQSPRQHRRRRHRPRIAPRQRQRVQRRRDHDRVDPGKIIIKLLENIIKYRCAGQAQPTPNPLAKDQLRPKMGGGSPQTPLFTQGGQFCHENGGRIPQTPLFTQGGQFCP